MRLKKFQWFFISSISFLYSASITGFSADKNIYNRGDVANLSYSISDIYKYKLRFRAYDTKGNLLSPSNFSAVQFGKISYIIPKNYYQNYITINLTLMDAKGNVVSKNLVLHVNNTVLLRKEYRILSGDDAYTSLTLPFSFHGYRVIYPNENGYITFKYGSTRFWDYVRAFNPMIWTSSRDLMTNVYVTIWNDKVKIRWSGGYFPNWHGSFNSWVILYKDGRIEQSSGGYYGF